jgi:hypothetical protein
MPSAALGLRLAPSRQQASAWRLRWSKSAKPRPAGQLVSTYANARSIRPLRSGFPTRWAQNRKPRLRAKAAMKRTAASSNTLASKRVKRGEYWMNSRREYATTRPAQWTLTGWSAGVNVPRCADVSCCIACPGVKAYSPARRGGLRRPAFLTQRVKLL